MLRDKRLVLAGVAGAEGVGDAVARRALVQGAHVTLVASPRRLERCRELAAALPRPAHVVCADLAREEDVLALREHLRCAYRTVDGAVLAMGPATADASAGGAFAALARAVAPLLPPGRGSLVGVTHHGAGPRPSALQRAAREVARDLAPSGGRANLVVAPAGTARAAADAVLLLLGPLADGVTGRVVHPGPAGRPAGRGDAGRPPMADRRTSDRRRPSAAQASARRIPGGRAPAQTPMTAAALPATPATTDQKGTSR